MLDKMIIIHDSTIRSPTMYIGRHRGLSCNHLNNKCIPNFP
jgi:hypothetical protein